MKIKVSDTAKLQKAIDAAEGRAKVRTVSAEEVLAEAERAQKKLDNLLMKKDQVGASVHFDLNAQSFPASYKGAPESTHIKITKFSSGWFVTYVGRGYCRANRLNELQLSAEQKEAMAQFVVKNF